MANNISKSHDIFIDLITKYKFGDLNIDMDSNHTQGTQTTPPHSNKTPPTTTPPTTKTTHPTTDTTFPPTPPPPKITIKPVRLAPKFSSVMTGERKKKITWFDTEVRKKKTMWFDS